MSPRRKNNSARTRYMIADFAAEEKDRVLKHCQKKLTSISKFLAGVALEEVHRDGTQAPPEQELTIKLKIPAEKNAKLQMFARRQEKSVEQFVQDLVLPTLEKGKTSFSSKTESLRYYLSPEEHQLLKKHLKARNLSARTYISYLALKALNQQEKK